MSTAKANRQAFKEGTLQRQAHLRTIACYMRVRISLGDITTILANDNAKFHFATVRESKLSGSPLMSTRALYLRDE